MQIKKFDEKWDTEEINEYIGIFNILVLFEILPVIREANMLIYGKNLTDTQKLQLKEFITSMFGGQTLTDDLCIKINEFAVKWYNKVILCKRARVLNSGKKE